MPLTHADKLAKDLDYANRRSARGRDIAPIPPVADPARRRACADDFRLFAETYFARTFSLAWSDDHLRIIATIERVVREGGLNAIAMPRGSGKTSLCEKAALWSVLYAYRRFVLLIGAAERHASSILERLKHELTRNQLLVSDFPEACHALKSLGGNARKAGGQLCSGEPTAVTWAADRVTFPILPADAYGDWPNVGGTVLAALGITGALRGLSHSLPDGRTIRPDLVICDDVQTRESAHSPSQCADRLATISGDVLGLAGPGQRIAALMPCTVIREGDLADTLLDREKNPAWQGERTRMVYAWPTNEKLWTRYLAIRADGLRSNGDTSAATDFYRANRDAMDAGARVAWPARKDPGQLSALEHAICLRADLGEAFDAEYQNAPTRVEPSDALPELTPAQVAAKTNGLKRGVVPLDAQHVTAFVDVHDALLFWTVCAWAQDFSGSILDYATWPRQRFTAMRKARNTLATAHPSAGREGAILAGLTALVDELCGRAWVREDGTDLRIARCLIDSGYQPDTVTQVARRSAHAAVLLPSRGLGIGPKSRPISEYRREAGVTIGAEWMLTTQRGARVVRFDSNYWKSFVAARLQTALGDPGSLSLCVGGHQVFAEHLCSERATLVSANGRTVPEWSLRPGGLENHWLDCAVGCAVAASLCGATLPGAEPVATTKVRKRVSWAARQRAMRSRP